MLSVVVDIMRSRQKNNKKIANKITNTESNQRLSMFAYVPCLFEQQRDNGKREKNYPENIFVTGSNK